MPIDNSSDPWVDHTSNCWLLEKHHHPKCFAVKASFKTNDPPRWSGLLSPRADALRENRGLGLNCHENNHSFKHCRHPFTTASACLNPELSQLGDDDAHRHRQTRRVFYHRDDKSSRPNNHKKNRRHLPGQSRGYHQDHGHVYCHNDTTYTSDHHDGILRSTASSAPASAPRMRFGAAHHPGENTLARQPGTFRTGNRQLGGGRHRRQHCQGAPLLVSEDARVLLLACPVTQHRMPLSRAHGLLRRLRTTLTVLYRWRELALRAWFPPAGVFFFRFFSTTRTRASSGVPPGHSLRSATGTALSAPIPSTAA